MMKRYPTMNAILKKKNEVFTWIAIVSMLITVVGGIAGAVIYSRSIPDPIPMNDAIIEEHSNEWCYIDVEMMSDYFATYEEDDVVKHRYYFVWDEEFMYIALLDSKTANSDLAAAFEYFSSDDDTAPEPVRIQGMSVKIPLI